MRKIKKSTAILLVAVLVSGIMVPLLCFFIFKPTNSISISSYNGLSINMQKYNALGIATQNKYTEQINNKSLGSQNNMYVVTQDANDTNTNQIIIGQTEEEEKIEEVVFEDTFGRIHKQDLDIRKAIIFDKFTFIQTYHPTNPYDWVYSNSAVIELVINDTCYIIDHISGDIFALKNNADCFVTIDFPATKNENSTRGSKDWCESETGVYFNLAGSGHFGGIYKLQNTNGKMQMIEVFNCKNCNDFSELYILKYVDKYDNIFVWRYDYSKPEIPMVYGFFKEKGHNNYEFAHLNASPAGRQPDGRVFMQDGLSYFDKNGELQQAEQQVDITFFAQLTIGEFNNAKYYIFMYTTELFEFRFEIYKHTSTEIKLIFSTTALSSVSYVSTIVYGMPKISLDTVTFLEENRRVASYNFRSEVYEQSDTYWSIFSNFCGGFERSEGEILTFRFLSF